MSFLETLICEYFEKMTRMGKTIRRELYLPDNEFERDCRLETLRRSGPGGQNRNKVETGVRIYHIPSGCVGEATERRYQGENRKQALFRLRMELALRLRAPIRVQVDDQGVAIGLETSLHWFTRRGGDKRILVSKESLDYPTLVADFFDVYAAVGEDLPTAARLLQTTPSQIVRFLNKIPAVLNLLNEQREKKGLRRLRA